MTLRENETYVIWNMFRRKKMQFDIGDIITLKKGHPCGANEWEVLRVGADFRLKCNGCGHMVMVPRTLVEKNLKKHMKKSEE